ncbi:TetR/AcrR family transcriptional regulator [Kitasatospora sp. NPDC088134]|uniref:TetR/AcrR family transcriptional regulator n=1 Tax=Kitasatospora sp. NPDC088134 TaxID=3364071 RepID=UPI0037F9425F
MNHERRDRLGDAAIEVLAASGGRGLTHRAVDAAAHLPQGTAKNYFPTREDLLRATAERCAAQYREISGQLAAAGPPADRGALAALLVGLLDDVAGPGRPRMVAYLELQIEAARRPELAPVVDAIAAADLADLEALQQAAGLPVTPGTAAALALALHGALLHLVARGPATAATARAGLEDTDRFVRTLLDAVYPPR